jgi:ABC-type multidrug transport system fused ATPase/permease subunit
MVFDDLEKALAHAEESGERELGPLSEGIEFRKVCFAYDEDDGDVLHDVNVSVPANHTIALVGESGAGKSTIVDMMTLMLRPRTGEVYIDEVPAEEVDLASWRSQIGYVSQETVVFDDTVANNISLWQGDVEADPALRERVIDAAERAHADHFIRDLPNGYQTVVGDRGVRLSGGQRQRLFVARELFKQPNLLLLDEATSDLDTASEHRCPSGRGDGRDYCPPALDRKKCGSGVRARRGACCRGGKLPRAQRADGRAVPRDGGNAVAVADS